MPRLRKSLLWAGASVGLVAGVGAAAWLYWLPGKVREGAVDTVEHRLGMRATIGEVSLKTRGVVLSDIRVSGTAGGLQIAIHELGVRASPWDLALNGSSAVEAVQIRGLEVELDGAHDGFDETLEAIALARAPGSLVQDTSRSPRSHFDIEIVDLSVDVMDAAGDLVAVDDAGLVLASDSIDFHARMLVLGGAATHRVSLQGTHLVGTKRDVAWNLSSLDVESGDLTWSTPPRVDSEALEEPDEEGEEEESPDESVEEEPNVGDLAVPEDEPDAENDLTERATASATVLGRLTSLASKLRNALSGGAAAEQSDGQEAPDTEEAPAWRRLLAEDAKLTVVDLTVNTEAGGESRPLLRRLRLEAEVTGTDELRLEGSGAAATGGSLGFRWQIQPRALRGEGTITLDELPLALVAPLVPDLPWHRPERARLDGELVVTADSAARLGFRGRVVVRGAALDSPRISPHPVTGVDFSVEGRGAWIPAERRLEVEELELGLGDARARVVGALEWSSEHYLVDLTATMPPTSCNTAVQAIPDDLLAEVAGFGFRGRIGGRVRALVDSRDLEHGRLDVRVADGCEFQTIPAVADLRRVRAPFLHRVVEPDGTVFEMTTGPGTGNWVSIHGISPYFVHAVLGHEDAGFFRHGGFAPWAIRDALLRNLREGRYVVGASTITMQLAKNLFLHREKTLARKVQEVLLTWWLESSLEKREILELYLNVIEYGPAIYGIRNAAWHYFGRDPEELSPAESAFLAIILPAPKRFHTSYEEGSLGVRMGNRVRRFLRHMHARGRLDDEALVFGLSEIDTLRFYREGAPLPAPRVVPGNAGALPFATVDATADEWDEFDEGQGFGVEPDEEGGMDEVPTSG